MAALRSRLGPAREVLAAQAAERVEETDDAYRISRRSDTSLKARAGLMAVKRLVRMHDTGLEQSMPVMKAPFPLSAADTGSVLAALGVDAPPPAAGPAGIGELAAVSPGRRALRCGRRRRTADRALRARRRRLRIRSPRRSPRSGSTSPRWSERRRRTRSSGWAAPSRTSRPVSHALDPYDPDVVQGTVLDRAEVDRQIERYRTRTADERRAIAGLRLNRAEVILAGACVSRTVLGRLGRDALTMCDRGPRHGLLAERFGHAARPGPRGPPPRPPSRRAADGANTRPRDVVRAPWRPWDRVATIAPP